MESDPPEITAAAYKWFFHLLFHYSCLWNYNQLFAHIAHNNMGLFTVFEE